MSCVLLLAIYLSACIEWSTKLRLLDVEELNGWRILHCYLMKGKESGVYHHHLIRKTGKRDYWYIFLRPILCNLSVQSVKGAKLHNEYWMLS